jgi:hypothetical protein
MPVKKLSFEQEGSESSASTLVEASKARSFDHAGLWAVVPEAE